MAITVIKITVIKITVINGVATAINGVALTCLLLLQFNEWVLFEENPNIVLCK